MRGKSLILTYHRIVEDGAATTFYDVTMSQYREHVAKVARARDPSITITFDDGTADHKRAAEILADHGLKGVFFLVLNRLDTPGYLKRDDVRNLCDLGQIVGSHTMTHPQLPTLTNEQLSSELGKSRAELAELSGGSIDWFAPPGGLYDQRTLKAAKDAGYRFVRTMDWGYAPELSPHGVESLLSTVPVLRTTNEARFDIILSGRATFNAFKLKQGVRRILPPGMYDRLRNLVVRTS